MSKFRDFQVGTRVKLTGKFLRSTGQGCSPLARSTWTITGFDDCGFAVTNERLPAADVAAFYSPDELATHPHLAFRRFNVGNLCIVGQADSRNCP